MDEVLEFLTDIHRFISPVTLPCTSVEQSSSQSSDDDKIVQIIKAVVQWARKRSTLHEVSQKLRSQ